MNLQRAFHPSGRKSNAGWVLLLAAGLLHQASPIQAAAAAPPAAATKACVLKVRQVSADDPPNAFPVALLAMAMTKTEREYGPCALKPVRSGTSSRNIRMVQQGELDVEWSVTTVEREQALRPVRIPIFQGMHGYRVFIIRKEDAPRFAQVKTLSDLRHLTAGQMHDWQSTAVLAANKIPLELADNFDGLFSMLAKGRFDYFPRALHEPVSELKNRPDLPLMIEPTLLLHYVAAAYFFVHPGATQLAERIRLGLERGIADGSRDQLREQIIGVSALLRQLNVKKRRVIELANPTLPGGVPLQRKDFWLDLNAL